MYKIKCFDCHTSYIGGLAETSQLDWLRTNERRGKAMAITLLNITDSRTTLLTGQCSTNYFQGLTLESWFTSLEQTPPSRCQSLTAPYKRLIHDINITNEPNSAAIAVITPLPAFYSQDLNRKFSLLAAIQSLWCYFGKFCIGSCYK